MRLYATDATLRLGVSHARALIPDLLAFIAEAGFQAERNTSLTAPGTTPPTEAGWFDGGLRATMVSPTRTRRSGTQPRLEKAS